MKVAAFSYVRNGVYYDYPFAESIKSILPVVDEFIMVVGDSKDGSRELVEQINDPKIKIVDSVWDPKMRSGGHIFAQQANIGLDHVSKDADWIFHIQADELIHEKDLPAIRTLMEQELPNKKVEGLLFPFIHFFGDYRHYAPSRRFHQREIRIIRNHPSIRSFRDSQGFRVFNNPDRPLDEKGRKLRVKLIEPAVYHYSYVKSPEKQLQKQIEFGKRWHDSDEWIKASLGNKSSFDYTKIDFLYPFKGTHPALMKERIAQQDWTFDYNPAMNNMKLKEKLLKFVQETTGKQLFISKNYTII